MFNESQGLERFFTAVHQVTDSSELTWEIVFVNDGSTDNTLEVLQALKSKSAAQSRPIKIRVLDLSRNFGKEAALSAGIDYVSGRAAIPIDADLQDPPELIPELVKKWNQGFDVVNAVRRTRSGEGWAKRWSAFLFYRLLGRLSTINIPCDTGDFRLISRPVIEVLKRLPERRRFMKGLFAWVGFKVGTVYYDRPNRVVGKSSWNYLKLTHFAIEGITSFSTAPLRLCTYFGLLTALCSLIYSLVVVFKTIVWGDPVAGYPSLMVVVLFLGAVQLIALGIIGEYLGRVYEESKQRPLYVVREIYETDEQ